MGKKLEHRRHNIGQRRRWWLVAAGAVFVVALGKIIAARAEQKKTHVVDLAGEEHK